MLYFRAISVLVILFFFNGCAGRTSYQLLQATKPIKASHISAASIEYKILPQDRLKVVLYKDPGQISTEQAQKIGENINPGGILVNAAGYIKLPLVGKLRVAGLTQTQAAEMIERAYRKYLTDPSVYVEIMNKRIIVLGEVRKPGVIKLDKEKMTLFEALGFAGGLTDDAVRNDVVIVSHIPNDGLTMRKVDLTDFGHMDYASLMLRPNDIVYIKPNGWKEFRVNANNYTSPFETVTKILSPFAMIKTLSR